MSEIALKSAPASFGQVRFELFGDICRGAAVDRFLLIVVVQPSYERSFKWLLVF